MGFENALKRTLVYEGGYVNNPADHGGETKYGITKRVAIENGYVGNMKDLNLEFASKVYKKKYWDINNLDAVDAISSKVAEEIFDFGCNFGVMSAAKSMQEGLNLLNENGKIFAELAVDGIIGSGTIKAIKILDDKNRADDICLVVKAIRIGKYLGICRKNPTQRVFIRGWLRRVFISKSFYS